MDTFWFIILAVLLAGISITVGVVRNRRHQFKERLHQSVATALSLNLAYAAPRDYQIYGTHREYPIQIEAMNLARPGAKEPDWYTKISIPMVNPRRKMIRITRRNDAYEALERLVQVGKPTSVGHDLADWMDIQTNDLMFSSLILTENVKISLFQAFQPLAAGLCYIEDEELAFVMPGLLEAESQVQPCIHAASLLADIKDELNR